MYYCSKWHIGGFTLSRANGLVFINNNRQYAKNSVELTTWLHAEHEAWEIAELILELSKSSEHFHQFIIENGSVVDLHLSSPIYSRTKRHSDTAPTLAMMLLNSPMSSKETRDMALNCILKDKGHLKSGYSALLGACIHQDYNAINTILDNHFWTSQEELEMSCVEFVSSSCNIEKSLSDSISSSIIAVLENFNKEGLKTFDLDVLGKTPVELYIQTGLDDVAAYLSAVQLDKVLDETSIEFSVDEKINLDEEIFLSNSL